MNTKYFFWFLFFVFLMVSCKPRNHVSHDVNKFQESNEIKTICFGSCNKQWEDQSYWKRIRKEQPDLWIWMGDIIYSDTEDMVQMKYQYDLQKNHREYIEFGDSCRIIGVWDDHDYGLNDGGAEYPKKKENRDHLFHFLEVPADNPAWDREGAYQSYVFGPKGKKVHVILLDGRYFRDQLDPDLKTDQMYLPNRTGTYLGEKQWEWLENELNQNKDFLHIIVSGIQVIPTEHNFEKWYNFPHERDRLFDLLISTGAVNSVLVSGDRHIGEHSVIQYKNHEFHEITTSGLTHSYESAKEENSFRSGPLITSRNFGKMDITWNENTVDLTLRIIPLTNEPGLEFNLEFQTYKN